MGMANTINATFLMLRTCKLVDKIIKTLDLCAVLIKYQNSGKYFIFGVSMLLMINYLVKLTLQFLILNDMTITLKLIPSLGSGLFEGIEFLVVVLCVEIKTRLRVINDDHLISAHVSGVVPAARVIRRVTKAYEALGDAMGSINRTFGLFFLLNMSQLFLLVLFTAITLITMPCVTDNNSLTTEFSRHFHCAPLVYLLIESMLRFGLLVWGCSGATAEVRY